MLESLIYLFVCIIVFGMVAWLLTTSWTCCPSMPASPGSCGWSASSSSPSA